MDVSGLVVFQSVWMYTREIFFGEKTSEKLNRCYNVSMKVRATHSSYPLHNHQDILWVKILLNNDTWRIWQIRDRSSVLNKRKFLNVPYSLWLHICDVFLRQKFYYRSPLSCRYNNSGVPLNLTYCIAILWFNSQSVDFSLGLNNIFWMVHHVSCLKPQYLKQ